MRSTPEKSSPESGQQEKSQLRVGCRVEFRIGSVIKGFERVSGSGKLMQGTVSKIMPTLIVVEGDDDVLRKMDCYSLKIID